MFSIKNNILYFIVFIALVQVQGLVELPAQEDNEIVVTESAVRNTVNGIFSILKLKRVKHKARFREFAAIHNFFVTITLQDHDNLKEIARLARVDNLDNKTQYFITQLNEVLNEDNKSYEATDDVYVTTHIETFIRKLEYLKHKYGFTNNAANFGINTEVLNHLGGSIKNGTKAPQRRNVSDGHLLSDEFWQPNGRRIFEGVKEKIKRFPFMASVQFFKKFQCAGSIIKSDLVITAASCLQLAWNNRFFRENPAFLSVQVGCEFYEGGDENIPILEVYFHPEYNPKNLRNNLAIMRMVRVLQFGKHVKKIKKINFDRNPWPLPETTPGITIIGWGARSSSNIIGNIWSNRLSYAELDFYPLKECQEVYSREYVTYKNFCAGFISKGGGACNRDVGSPGVAHSTLIGVVSFGSPQCGAPDAPTVFTKLGYYADWIEGILEMEHYTSRVRTTLRTTKESYKLEHFLTTKPQFKLPAVTEPEEGLSGQSPIQSFDALRALDENNLFKEFITTMFGSEEVKEYLDQYESDKSAEAKEIAKSDSAIKANANVIPFTKPTTKADLEYQTSAKHNLPEELVRSVEMVTMMEDFGRLEQDTVEAHTILSIFKDNTNRHINKDDEKIGEQNIAKLINDIDIQELLALDSSQSSSDNDKVKTTKKPKNTRVKYVKMIESPEASASTSDDNDDNDDHDNSANTLMGLLDFTNTIKDDSKEKEQGLSIPAESFKDFTFRQNTSSTGILDIFTRNDLMRLLTEAVAEAAKSKQYNYKS